MLRQKKLEEIALTESGSIEGACWQTCWANEATDQLGADPPVPAITAAITIVPANLSQSVR